MSRIEIKKYLEKNPNVAPFLRGRVNSFTDRDQQRQYSFTIAHKQGYIINQYIMLALGQPEDNKFDTKYNLFYETSIDQSGRFRYDKTVHILTQLNLLQIKMIARKGECSLTLAYTDQTKEFREHVFMFASKQLAEEWEILLNEKKQEAIQLRNRNLDKEELISHLKKKVNALQQRLQSLQREYDRICFEYAKSQEDNDHYKIYSQSLEEHIFRLKENYDRTLTENQTLIEEKNILKKDFQEMKQQKDHFQYNIFRLREKHQVDRKEKIELGLIKIEQVKLSNISKPNEEQNTSIVTSDQTDSKISKFISEKSEILGKRSQGKVFLHSDLS